MTLARQLAAMLEALTIAILATGVGAPGWTVYATAAAGGYVASLGDDGRTVVSHPQRGGTP